MAIRDGLRSHIPTGTTGIGYDTGSGYDSYIASDTQSLMYGINETVYLRIPFNVDDPSKVTALELQLKDGDDTNYTVGLWPALIPL